MEEENIDQGSLLEKSKLAVEVELNYKKQFKRINSVITVLFFLLFLLLSILIYPFSLINSKTLKLSGNQILKSQDIIDISSYKNYQSWIFKSTDELSSNLSSFDLLERFEITNSGLGYSIKLDERYPLLKVDDISYFQGGITSEDMIRSIDDSSLNESRKIEIKKELNSRRIPTAYNIDENNKLLLISSLSSISYTSLAYLDGINATKLASLDIVLKDSDTYYLLSSCPSTIISQLFSKENFPTDIFQFMKGEVVEKKMEMVTYNMTSSKSYRLYPFEVNVDGNKVSISADTSEVYNG